MRAPACAILRQPLAYTQLNYTTCSKGEAFLTRQANNIVSFDEARRATGARRVAAPSARQSAAYARPRAASAAPARPSQAPFRNPLYDERSYREDLRRERSSSRGVKAGSERPLRGKPEEARTSQAEDSEQSFETFFGKINDRAKKAKRQAAKQKADREFTKHYATDHAATPADAGPRAAVYRGEMGSQHKRAARMQNTAGGQGGFSVPMPRLSSFGKMGKRLVGGVAALACCAACCLFLYAPAQQYYQELRDRDRLAVEYAAVAERNEDIRSEVAYLSTPEGIQDRARQEFGWITEGEYAVSVSGLSRQDETAHFQANINAASIKAPDTWYSDVLDAFFGYE